MDGMKMITLFLPEEMLKDLDDLKEMKIGPNRSEIIRGAIEMYLNNERISSKLRKFREEINDGEENAM